MMSKIDIEQYFERHPSAWKENREFAAFLVNQTKPDVIVDLGVDWGHSTISWAENKPGKVYGVDCWVPNDYSNSGREFQTKLVPAFKSFHAQGLDNIELIKGDHVQVCESWTVPIDILHFDIDHTYAGVMKEHEMWKRHVKQDGVMVFHDLKSFPDGVGKWFEHHLTGPRLSFNNTYGLGVWSENESLIKNISENFDTTELK